MVELNLTPEDVTALRETLESVLSDLRYEINDTDSHDYREKLKVKKDLLDRVLGQLREG